MIFVQNNMRFRTTIILFFMLTVASMYAAPVSYGQEISQSQQDAASQVSGRLQDIRRLDDLYWSRDRYGQEFNYQGEELYRLQGNLEDTQDWTNYVKNNGLITSTEPRIGADTQIDRYVGRCTQLAQQVREIRSMAIEYDSLINESPLSTEVVNAISSNMESLHRLASFATDTTQIPVLGERNPCLYAAQMIYFVFWDAGSASGPDNKWVCLANYYIDPDNHPDNDGDGICKFRPKTSIDWGATSACHPESCRLNIPVRENDEIFISEVKDFEPIIEIIRNQVEEESSKLETVKSDASKDAAAAEAAGEAADAAARSELKRGSVVSLSLPFSDIPPAAVIGRIIGQILGVVGALALGTFIYGGVLYMTAAGNQDRLAKGKAVVIWSVLGLVVIFAAYAIVNFITTSLTG